MNRAIKFRAWDTVNERMIYDGDKVYPDHFGAELMRVSSPVEVYHNKVMLWVHETKLKEATDEYFDHPSYIPCHIFMQFTGLLDKNGKESYHNDIVLCGDGKPGLIIWKGYGWYVKRESEAHAKTENYYSYYPLSYCIENSEVIGNIYQDHHLLKDDNEALD